MSNHEKYSIDQLLQSAVMEDANGQLVLQAVSASGAVAESNVSRWSHDQILRSLFKENIDGSFSIAIAGLSGGGGGGAVDSVNGQTGTVILKDTHIATNAAITINGTAYAAGTTLAAIVTALNGAINASALNVITPTSYVDITAQTTATANGTMTQDTTRKDVVIKDLAGDTIVILGATSTAVMTAATTTAAGTGGTTPTNGIDSQNKFLKGDATFGVALPYWDSSTNWETGDSVLDPATNKIHRVTTAHTGGVFTSTNFAELAPSVAGVPTNVQLAGTGTATGTKLDLDYIVLTGTPIPSYTIASGIGTLTYSGGTAKTTRVQCDIDTAADVAAGGLFTLVINGLVASTMRRYPLVSLLYTVNGGIPSTVSPHQYRNQQTAPSLTVVGGTAGTSISIKTGDLTAAGTTASLVCML